ncbi:unnamed protein product [Blepharisma stoltei]|uniref:CHHC U11-48K-type domain-containing protein n=1 Tax=Blepharisma stoltei TaxID=1481888 RepID=A0AAU9J6B5_9CILI|nr:unnamed protein product [Blepharisma stoltei]
MRSSKESANYYDPRGNSDKSPYTAKTPDKKSTPNVYVLCPFNSIHHVLTDELDSHMLACPDRNYNEVGEANFQSLSPLENFGIFQQPSSQPKSDLNNDLNEIYIPDPEWPILQITQKTYDFIIQQGLEIPPGFETFLPSENVQKEEVKELKADEKSPNNDEWTTITAKNKPKRQNNEISGERHNEKKKKHNKPKQKDQKKYQNKQSGSHN